MKWINGCVFAFAFTGLVGCGGTDIAEFEGYGTGMPGSGLPVTGEVLMEKIFISPNLNMGTAGSINTFQFVYYNSDFGASEAEQPPPGGCLELQHNPSGVDNYPMNDLAADTEFFDVGDEITVSGPGISGTLAVPKVVAGVDGMTDNRAGNPQRVIEEGGFIYGGPGWQFGPDGFQDAELQEGVYTANLGPDIGDRTFNFAPEYDFPLNAGFEDVTIPATAPSGGLEITWEAIPNPNTPHSRTHTFTFITFIQFPNMEAGDRGPTALWLCTPEDTADGSVFVSQEILDSLPDQGVFNAGRATHYMDIVEDPNGEDKRLDLYTVYCSISMYTKAD